MAVGYKRGYVKSTVVGILGLAMVPSSMVLAESKFLSLMKLKVLLILVMFLTGCASNIVPLDDNKRIFIKNSEKVTVLFYGDVGPTISTVGNALSTLTIFGSAASSLSTGDNASDLRVKAARVFAGRLEKDAGFSNFEIINEPVPYNVYHKKELSGYEDGLYLQFFRWNWNFIYKLSNLNRYETSYPFLVRLIDKKTKHVYWFERCIAIIDKGDQAPTLEQLKENNYQLVKDWGNKMATQCGNELANKFLGVHKQ